MDMMVTKNLPIRESMMTDTNFYDEVLGDLFVATHGGKTAHDLPGNLDQHDYEEAKQKLLAHEIDVRIDELEHIAPHAYWFYGNAEYESVIDRIAALKKEKRG